ncbi:MAG: ABC transporter permease, partial [Bacteroidota bacterium]
PYFILVEDLEKEEQIEEAFKKEVIKEVIIFEDDFAAKLERENHASIKIIADASDANRANLIVNYTTAIIQDYQQEIAKNQSIPIQVSPVPRMKYNNELKSVYMFVPGTMALILMLISALMTSVSIVREKETGTMEVLLVSPLHPAQIVLGKVVPYIILSFINAITILLLSFIVFNLPVRGSLILLLAESMLFIILALSLGIFISTMTSNQQTALFISMFALMLPTILLSGFIFPIENMPLILQWLCQLMPPKWYISIVRDIMLKGTSFWHVWQETMSLAGMTLLFLFLSVIKFKRRLE